MQEFSQSHVCDMQELQTYFVCKHFFHLDAYSGQFRPPFRPHTGGNSDDIRPPAA